MERWTHGRHATPRRSAPGGARGSRRRRAGRQIAAPFGALFLLVGAAGPAETQQIVGDDVARATIEVRDLTRTGDGVAGLVVNLSPREVRSVRVLVQLVYHWPDEMHPGPRSPSAAAVVVVDGPIPPGGSTAFRATLGGRPDVAAGPGDQQADFEPRASLLGWKEVGVTPDLDAPTASEP